MVKNCCVVGCHKVKKKGGIPFYRFPTNPEKRSKWIAAVKRDKWAPNDHTWICRTHFVTGKRSNNPLAPNYVPSIFPQTKSPAKRRLESSAIEFERRQSTKRKRVSLQQASNQTVASSGGRIDGSEEAGEEHDSVNDVADNGGDHDQEEIISHEPCVSSSDGIEPVSFECSPSASTCERCAELEEELIAAKKRIKQLEEQNKKLSVKVLSRESLRDNDVKVQYYTGLPSYEILEVVFEFVTAGLPDSFATSRCSVFDQFLLVLMRLRHNAGLQDLGYRFDVHSSTVCRYFNKWLDVLHTRLHCFIKWPERENLLKTMPMTFRKVFRSCAVIIDCFEIFTERPTSLKARAQTWSNYKKHNTVKFLIGITPQGSVSFISKGWGGRVSDVHLTEHCGFLQHLLPGDVVLADRGFTIQDSVGLLCAEVKHPPFTRGKPQLSKLEVDTSRQLS